MKTSIALLAMLTMTASCSSSKDSSDKKNPAQQDSKPKPDVLNPDDEFSSLKEEEASDLALWGMSVLRAEEALGKYDVNSDGVLSDDERTVARLAIIKECDSNGDGNLKGDEIKACLIKRYDTNGDGKLSDEEKKVLSDIRKENVAVRWELLKKRAEEIRFKRYDTDGDGKLSDAERKKMEEERAKALQAIKDKRLENKEKLCSAIAERLKETTTPEPGIRRIHDMLCVK
jgi:hypothetical protein